MVLTDGLISYWKLDTNSSTEPDSVGSNDITVNGATYTASGKINGGYSLDGTNDRLVTPINTENVNDPDNGDFTVTGWFKSDSLNSDDTIFDSGAGGGGQQGAILTLNSNGTLEFKLRTSTKRYFPTPVGSLSAGTWYFFVFSWDQSTETITIYVNNSELYNTSASSNVSNSNTFNLTFGTKVDGSSEPFDGVLDELALWDRVLTSGERTSLYNSGDGLQYPFSSDTGTNMQINIGDSWKVVEGMQINIGDTWKEVVSVQQNIGDSWKTVF